MLMESNANLPPLATDDANPRRRRLLKAAAICAMLGALGVGAYKFGYPKLQEHNQWIAERPAVQKSLATVDERMKGAEERLREWAGDRETWDERVGKIESKLGSGLQAARRETQQVALQLRTEMERRTQSIQARLGNLESEEETARARVARLEQELDSTRSEMAQQLASLRQETNKDLDRVDRQLVGLNGELGDHQRTVQRDLDVLATRTERRRIDFEVTKNRTREIAPGVSLGVNKTSPAYRRVNGWLWLLPDRRTVWLKDQNVQRPVVFYTKEDSRPRELVFTHVTKDSVVGYVLMPARAGSGENLATTGSTASGAPPAR